MVVSTLRRWLVSLLSTLSGIIFVLAFIPYVRAILRDRARPDGAKPSRVSWLIWATLDSTTFYGMWLAHTVNGLIVGAICGAWLVTFLAFRYGTSGWTLLDKLTLMGAGLGLALMWVNPSIGIVTSCTVLFLGSLPTFVHTWHDASREDVGAWVLYWVASTSGVIAIPQWTWADAAQPVAFAVIETVMMYILFVHHGLWRRPTGSLSASNTRS